MAGTKISSFSSLDSGSLSANDTFLVVDVSDQLYSPNGTNKKTDLASILQSPLNPIRKNLLDLDDTPSGYGQIGQVLKVGPDGNSLIFSDDIASSGTGNASSLGLDTGDLVYKSETGFLSTVLNFSDLSDTPESLSSGDGKFLFVSGGSIQYKELDVSNSIINFTDLQDTPSSFAGNEGKYLIVSGGEINYGEAISNVDNSVSYDYRNIIVENSGAFDFVGLLDTPNSYGSEDEFLSFSGQNIVFKSLPTGSFITSGDLSGINLNLLSGLEEYLTSGEIENTYLKKSDTGNFLDVDSTGNFVVNNETGDFLDRSFTGNFVTNNQIENFVTDNETGNLVSLDYLNNYLRFDVSGNASVVSGEYKGSILGKDTFYGNGVVQDFEMSFSPENSHSILVSLNGLIQSSENNYYLSNNNSGLSFYEPIPSGMEIDVRHIGGIQGSSIKGFDNFSGNGYQKKFNLSYSSENAYSVMVSIGGLLQSSENNYYLSENNSALNFYEPVPSGLEIDVRHIAGPVMIGATTNIVSTPSFISLIDTPQTYEQVEKILVATPSGIEYSGMDFKSSFASLLDTPQDINTVGEVLVTSGDRIAFSGLDVRTSFSNLEDTPNQVGEEGQVLVASGDKIAFSGINIKSSFLELLDTPSHYSQEESVLTVDASGINYSQNFVKRDETGNFLYADLPTSSNEGQFISVNSSGELIYSGVRPINDYSVSYDYTRLFPDVVNTGALELTGLYDTPDYLPQNNQILSYFNQKWEYKTLEDSSVSKAWLSFKYTPSLSSNFDYESFNINSINRIDKGKYSISFTNTFQNQDYCFNGNGYSSDDGWPVVPSKSSNQQNSNSTFYLSVKSGQELVDPTEDYIHLSFFAN